MNHRRSSSSRTKEFLEETFILVLLFLVGGGLGILIDESYLMFFLSGVVFCAAIFTMYYFMKRL